MEQQNPPLRLNLRLAILTNIPSMFLVQGLSVGSTNNMHLNILLSYRS